MKELFCLAPHEAFVPVSMASCAFRFVYVANPGNWGLDVFERFSNGSLRHVQVRF